ncbi:MAG: hypothetical protein HC910_21275 [Spirulinaceae cyanobacterium SM2_1_0]|nr:hypothetical protein [Spirulinaceae cyanobacterium SM2_1_0]
MVILKSTTNRFKRSTPAIGFETDPAIDAETDSNDKPKSQLWPGLVGHRRHISHRRTDRYASPPPYRPPHCPNIDWRGIAENPVLARLCD